MGNLFPSIEGKQWQSVPLGPPSPEKWSSSPGPEFASIRACRTSKDLEPGLKPPTANHPRRPPRQGFTIIELAVVVGMISAAALIGWGSIQSYLPRYRLVSVAKGMRMDLMQLRGEAIQSNREARLRLLSPAADCGDMAGWGGTWELSLGNRSNGSTGWDLMPEDSAVDGRDDDQSESLVDIGAEGNRAARHICLEPWSPLAGPSGASADAIVFSPRGWVSNPSTDFNAQGYIEVILSNQEAASRGVRDALTLSISRAGMVRLQSSLTEPRTTGSVGTGASTSL